MSDIVGFKNYIRIELLFLTIIGFLILFSFKRLRRNHKSNIELSSRLSAVVTFLSNKNSICEKSNTNNAKTLLREKS
jgi:hypothetical protein